MHIGIPTCSLCLCEYFHLANRIVERLENIKRIKCILPICDFIYTGVVVAVAKTAIKDMLVITTEPTIFSRRYDCDKAVHVNF